MRKVKLGLQKEVSKIFTGISVPGKKSPEASGAEQTKAVVAGSQVSSCTDVQPQQAPPAVPAQPVQQPSDSVPPKAVTLPVEVAQSHQVVTPPPATVLKPTGGTHTKSVVPTGPVTQTPRPFTIPEPPQQKTREVKSPVYEPPARKQAIYEPPPPSVPMAETSARPKNVEVVTPAPARQSFLLKILRPVTDKFLAPRPGISPMRQKVTLIIVAILPFVLISVLIKFFVVPATGGVKTVKATGVAATVKNQINWQLPPPLPDNFRDPMVFGSSSQNQQEQAEAGPIVKGIVYSEDNPCAVVGDRIVSAGDTVNGATVVKINPDNVEFASGDKKWSQKVER